MGLSTGESKALGVRVMLKEICEYPTPGPDPFLVSIAPQTPDLPLRQESLAVKGKQAIFVA